MTLLRTDRTTANTPEDHVADHNILHALHDILDGSTGPSLGSAAVTAEVTRATAAEATLTTAQSLLAAKAAPTFTGHVTVPDGTSSQDAAAFHQIPTTLPPSGSAGGDLLGSSYPNPTVVKINGIALTGSAPIAGQVPTIQGGATTFAWVTPSGAPTGAAGSDLSGSYPNPTVAKINGIAVTGTPALGQVPTATGTSAATWQNPAGGAPSGTATGDLSASYPNPTVSKINGVALTGSAPTVGQVLTIQAGGTTFAWATPSAAAGGVLKIGDTMTGELLVPQIQGTGTPPAVAAGAGLGLIPAIPPTTPAIGTNMLGTVTFVTGVNPGKNGVMVIITFSAAFPSTPISAWCTAGNKVAARDGPFCIEKTDLTTTTLSLRLHNPQPSTPYTLKYGVS